MNDVEIYQKQIAQLTDCLDRATARVEALMQERQRLGYDLHINQSKDAEARLGQLRQERLRLGDEMETLVGAIAELKKRLAAAREVMARSDANEHRQRARASDAGEAYLWDI